MNEKQKAAAWDAFCEQVRSKIDDAVDEWLQDNPYKDTDYAMSFGKKETTENDAIEDLCGELQNQADNMGFYDIFDLAIWEVYRLPLHPHNELRKIVGK